MRKSFLNRGLLALAMGSSALTVRAADGTWTQLSGGSATGTWSDATTSTWNGGIVADGSGFTADFSTLNITANSTVTLGAPRTIGNLIFGDTDTSTAGISWILAGTSPNVLTLAGSAPTITVNTLATNSLVTITAPISGSDGLTKGGAGLLALSGANNYAGGTTVSVGTLRALNNSALGTGAVSVANGAFLQLQGGISIANNITLNGGSALNSTVGNNTITGTVTLQAASTIVATNASGTSLTLNNINFGSNTLTLSASAATQGLLTVTGALTGTGNIIKGGQGPLTINNDQTATYSGITTLSSGNLILGNDGSLGTGTFAFVVSNDGTATIRSLTTAARTIANVMTIGGNGNSVQVFGGTNTGNLTFTNTTNIALGTAFRKFSVVSTTEIDAGFTGSGGIIKQTGTGTLLLKGTSTYNGATTVSAGTLIVGINGVGSLGNTAVAVNTGATLGGSGSITGSVTANASTINPGNTVGTLTTGVLTLTGASTLQIDVDTVGNTADKLVVNNGASATALGTGATLAFNFGGFVGDYGGVFTLIQNNGSGLISGNFVGLVPDPITGEVSFNNQGLVYLLDYTGGDGNDLTVAFTTVPEPASASLLGLTGLALVRRRRRK